MAAEASQRRPVRDAILLFRRRCARFANLFYEANVELPLTKRASEQNENEQHEGVPAE